MNAALILRLLLVVALAAAPLAQASHALEHALDDLSDATRAADEHAPHAGHDAHAEHPAQLAAVDSGVHTESAACAQCGIANAVLIPSATAQAVRSPITLARIARVPTVTFAVSRDEQRIRAPPGRTGS